MAWWSGSRRAQRFEAHARLVAKLDPPSFSVEEMADLKGGVELIVGARWDPRFGPTVLVGMGGTATEVLRDVQVALAPVDEAEAARMIERLRTAALLGEHRGRPAVDIAAAARAVARLSEYAAAHPEIAELEINPCSSPHPERPLSTPASSSTTRRNRWTSHTPQPSRS